MHRPLIYFLFLNKTSDCADFFYRHFRMPLPVEPAKQAVKPFPAKAEPAAGADLFTTETKDELAVAMALEGEADVHELEVTIAARMGIVEGFPHGQDAGVLEGVGLAHATREPEEHVSARVDADAAADDLAAIFHDERLALPAPQGLLFELLEELLAGEVAPYLGGIDVVEHAGEAAHLFHRLCFVYRRPVLQSFLHLADARGAEAFFYAPDAVEGVAYP